MGKSDSEYIGQETLDFITKAVKRATSVPAKAAPPEDAPPEAPPEAKPQKPGQIWTLPGILGSTRVTTNFGHVPAQLVRVGDYVKARRNGYCRVTKIREHKIDEAFVASFPDARPIRIQRGAFSRGLPERDIAVSPAQTVCIETSHTREMKIKATEITALRVSFDTSLGMFAFYELVLDMPDDVLCEGVWLPSGEA